MVANVALEKKRTESVGRPAIGGAYTLTHMNGKPFSNTDLHGSWHLIYFGFTFCPDICPEELDKMSEALTILGAELLFGRLCATCRLSLVVAVLLA